MNDFAQQVAAFAKAHGGTVRTGPQPRKPESYPQASGGGYSQALTHGSALAPSRPHAPAHAHAHAPAGTREALAEGQPCIGRTQPLESPPRADPWIDYTDDFTVWSQGK
jgi:hypothetical protein